MQTINRDASNKIITQAVARDQTPLTGILPQHAKNWFIADDGGQLQELLSQHPGAYIVYNQHPQALTRVKQLQTPELQVVIEIHQETEGVLGLQAKYKNSKPGDTLELVYR